MNIESFASDESRRPPQEGTARQPGAPEAPHGVPGPAEHPATEHPATEHDEAPFPPPTPAPRQWRFAVVPDALDRLRDHPDFDLHGERAARDASGTVLAAHNLSEADREALYHIELQRIFRQRLRFAATLSMFLIPLLTFMDMRLLPATQEEVLLTYLLLFGVSLVTRMVAWRLATLWQARLLSLVAYALYAIGAGVIVALMDQNRFENQFLIYYSHNYIVLSTLLMPYSVGETLVVGAIVLASLAWSAWWAAPPGIPYFYGSHLFVLAMTTGFVACVAHFQNLLRRRAFDAAFDLARSAAVLSELSTTDVVTGGFNRLHLEKILVVEIVRAARFERPLSLLMFDLDNFKIVNDTHGHAAGDAVLREVWQGAMDMVREIDTVARYGGDEFLIVLPETNAHDAHAIAVRLQHEVNRRLRARFGAHSPEGRVTLSIGATTFHDSEPASNEHLIARADARLYEAKRAGKNRIAG